ncbi:MAG: hypothetical protein AB7O65_07410, partial [Candidatus Korobacteraceae bacterium]
RSLGRELAVGASYYYRTTKNQIGRFNSAIPRDVFFLDSSRAFTNPLTGDIITPYNIPTSYRGRVDYLLTNTPVVDDNRYDGLEITAERRFDKKWMLRTGVTFQRNRGVYSNGTSDNFNDPNQDINRMDGSIDQDARVLFKLSGIYVLPLKIQTSVNFTHTGGYAILPSYTVSGLNLAESIKLAPNGSERLSDVNLMNLRLSRPTKVTESFTLEPVVDLNNLTNTNAVIAKATTWGANFLRPTNVVNPFVARFGLKLTW